MGLAAFTDPLRDGVPAAVAALSAAGVATIVVTGDHPATAAAVAAQAGLPGSQVIPGGDAEAMPDAELEPRLRHGAVIARATPALKHRVVQLLQRRGEIVAVTGDGANDAPARPPPTSASRSAATVPTWPAPPPALSSPTTPTPP